MRAVPALIAAATLLGGGTILAGCGDGSSAGTTATGPVTPPSAEVMANAPPQAKARVENAGAESKAMAESYNKRYKSGQ